MKNNTKKVYGFRKPNNSWQKVNKWYGKITEGEGHYYHRNVIIPKLLNLLNLKSDSKVLDFGCGSGILGRSIDKNISYTGVDLSSSLVKEAERQDKSARHKYIVGDASSVNLKEYNFTHCVFVLSFQNIKEAALAISNSKKHLVKGGLIVLVLNHPAFRIPRQSSWQIDNNNKTEYRRVNKYMSNMEIPINMNPSSRNSELTWSYHYPISSISKMLTSNDFSITNIEEWTSDKQSVGAASKMENAARNEFPLFMTIVGVKKAD